MVSDMQYDTLKQTMYVLSQLYCTYQLYDRKEIKFNHVYSYSVHLFSVDQHCCDERADAVHSVVKQATAVPYSHPTTQAASMVV